jgi:2,3-bisphosphoglycerate-independent phosphoglycerate mutase
MSRRPLIFVVMDGVGITDKEYGNAVLKANTPFLDEAFKNSPNLLMKAHGTAVGLPTDEDMGNSEVGHNAIGCGQIYAQGAKLVNKSIENGTIFESETWKELVSFCKDNTMHFIGLLSDGNVHSNMTHLKTLISQAKKEGIKNVRVHALLDGRDVPSKSALEYVDMIEDHMDKLNDDTFFACIASGGGRMKVTMDRYEAEWSMVELGWKTHVMGEGPMFKNATEAITENRDREDVSDQYLDAFVIEKNGKPVGKIEDNDSVVFFNFRGDRALEISRAFEEEGFDKFDRVVPDVKYAGMLQYDGDLKIPKRFLVTPPRIKNTLSEELIKHDIKMFAISETQKYGHVTYFWNGNKSGKFSDEHETFVEVTSDLVPFEQRPWMKAAEITDKLIEAIMSKKYDFLRINYPNGDMVGHTGNFLAAQISVEAVDLMLSRVKKAVDAVNGILVIVADHGNADEMFEKAKDQSQPPKPKTAHTLNPVPFIVMNKEVELKQGDFGLANVAASLCKLMDIEPNDVWEESMIK